MTELQQRLFELQDLKYREFHSRLMPGIDKDKIIGIRIPVLKKFAKEYMKEPGWKQFLKELPHKYYEEDNLHMILIGSIKDYDTCMAELKNMLPYIDNWATCDFPTPRIFEDHKEDVLKETDSFLASNHTYTVRYGIGLLMRLFLDDDFRPEYPEKVAAVHSDEYYINMMIAWYFATALAIP